MSVLRTWCCASRHRFGLRFLSQRLMAPTSGITCLRTTLVTTSSAGSASRLLVISVYSKPRARFKRLLSTTWVSKASLPRLMASANSGYFRFQTYNCVVLIANFAANCSSVYASSRQSCSACSTNSGRYFVGLPPGCGVFVLFLLLCHLVFRLSHHGSP